MSSHQHFTKLLPQIKNVASKSFLESCFLFPVPEGGDSFGVSDYKGLGRPALCLVLPGFVPKWSTPRSWKKAWLRSSSVSTGSSSGKHYIYLFMLLSPGELVCLSGLSIIQFDGVLKKEKHRWRPRLSPSPRLSPHFCLQTRSTQYPSIQQMWGMNWRSEPTSTLSSRQGPTQGEGWGSWTGRSEMTRGSEVEDW